MFVCLCNGVTDTQIIKAIKEGCDTIKKIRCCTGAMTRCGKCGMQCKEILASTIVHDTTEFSNTLSLCPTD